MRRRTRSRKELSVRKRRTHDYVGNGLGEYCRKCREPFGNTNLGGFCRGIPRPR